jgi:hypothetical protein
MHTVAPTAHAAGSFGDSGSIGIWTIPSEEEAP